MRAMWLWTWLSMKVVVVTLVACTGARGSYWGPSRGSGLVGGVTDDNLRLPEYLDYVAAYPHGDVPKLDLTDRRVITMLDRDGRPLWDAPITVCGEAISDDYRCRTNAAGQFNLPLAALGATPQTPLNVLDGWINHSLPRDGDVIHSLLTARASQGVAVDVALVVDTTGSMADEIHALRTTLQSVVRQVGSHALHPRVRIGGVAYRDCGDEYVTRVLDFTDNMRAVQCRLDTTEASGGGDDPEAVQEALDAAVNRLSWGSTGTVRILFLIGDAPPHFDRGTPYTLTMRRALEKGITIFPVACSGMNDRGEFVWRQLAAVTLGKFLFVSYGGTTEHHTGPYVENDLDQLMLRAIRGQLDALKATTPWVDRPTQCVPMPIPVPPDLHVPDPYRGDRIGHGRAPWDFIPGWN